MGIEIVSVLAKYSTKLASSAVGRLKPYYDPQEHPGEYMLKVISWWSAGKSHRSPTWGELLSVIQDIGHKKLSQQIEDFMRSKLLIKQCVVSTVSSIGCSFTLTITRNVLCKHKWRAS